MTISTTGIKAYDTSKYQRIIGNEGGRVQGIWHALGDIDKRPNKVIIWPIDVRVYADDSHGFALILKRDDFAATVTDGVPDLDPKHIREQVRADCEEAWDELMAVLVAVAAEFQAPHKVAGEHS